MPVMQNRAFATAAEALATAVGDVVLVQNQRSGLIYNEAFDPSRLVYDEEYQNEQASSGVFRRHLTDVEAVIRRHWQAKSLIEIGCGKGYFLERLLAAGFTITGIDPAYQGTNPAIVRSRFEKGLGLSADGIILRHVLEHIPDPLSFLSQIATANGGAGTIYIEVPCFDWIRQHRAWFDIFYEHVNYFRLQDFFRMFGRVYETGRLFGGQYLFVIADLASLRPPRREGDDDVEMPPDFLGGVNRAVSLAHASGARRAVWGGASKGVIFSLYMQRAGIEIDEVIDINPAKQGRYLPGTGLKVSDPERALGRLSAADNIFVMNSNYLDEIMASSGNKYSYVTVDHDGV
jgi:SAM-dependent methyltransferase